MFTPQSIVWFCGLLRVEWFFFKLQSEKCLSQAQHSQAKEVKNETLRRGSKVTSEMLLGHSKPAIYHQPAHIKSYRMINVCLMTACLRTTQMWFWPTLPARFADGLDINTDRDAVQCPLLATVPGRHLDLVLLLPVVAQLFCVPDVSWCIREDFIQTLLLWPPSADLNLWFFLQKKSPDLISREGFRGFTKPLNNCKSFCSLQCSLFYCKCQQGSVQQTCPNNQVKSEEVPPLFKAPPPLLFMNGGDAPYAASWTVTQTHLTVVFIVFIVKL